MEKISVTTIFVFTLLSSALFFEIAFFKEFDTSILYYLSLAEFSKTAFIITGPLTVGLLLYFFVIITWQKKKYPDDELEPLELIYGKEDRSLLRRSAPIILLALVFGLSKFTGIASFAAVSVFWFMSLFGAYVSSLLIKYPHTGQLPILIIIFPTLYFSAIGIAIISGTMSAEYRVWKKNDFDIIIIKEQEEPLRIIRLLENGALTHGKSGGVEFYPSESIVKISSAPS